MMNEIELPTHSRSRTGGIVLWGLLGLAGIGAVLFVISAPFNAGAKGVYSNATQWTPRRIQDNPSGYMMWAMEECSGFMETLEVHRLSLWARRHSVDRASQEAQNRKRAAEALLANAKTVYRDAQSGNKWPAPLKSEMLTETQLQHRIVRLHSATERQSQLGAEYARLKPIIALRLEGLEERINEVEDLQCRLAANTELVRLSQSDEDFHELHDHVSSLLDMNNALGDVNKLPDVESVIGHQVEVAAHNETFDSIMKN